jgi:hypothetical protein
LRAIAITAMEKRGMVADLPVIDHAGADQKSVLSIVEKRGMVAAQ